MRNGALLSVVNSSTSSESTVPYETLKLDIDAHALDDWVSAQVDGATPWPMQKMTYNEPLLCVIKQ